MKPLAALLVAFSAFAATVPEGYRQQAPGVTRDTAGLAANYRLETELLGEPDQHAHERLIVRRSGEIRHEAAVDLDEIDA